MGRNELKQVFTSMSGVVHCRRQLSADIRHPRFLYDSNIKFPHNLPSFAEYPVLCGRFASSNLRLLFFNWFHMVPSIKGSGLSTFIAFRGSVYNT